MRTIIITLLLIISTTVLSQSQPDSCGSYVGLSMVSSVYRPYHGEVASANVNFEFGATLVFCFRNSSLLKTGVAYTFYRGKTAEGSHNASEYIHVPFLIPFADFSLKRGSKIQLLLGPQLGMLARYGEKDKLSSVVNYQPGSFGAVSKIGIISELAFIKPKATCYSMCGLRASFDVSDLVFTHSSKEIQTTTFMSLGVFLNLNRRFK